MINIEQNAIFIADSHYPHHNSQLLEILNSIYTKESTTQLFLMGDIFDLLIGNSKILHDYSIDAIQLINELSIKIDIYYLEGNHDFLLKEYFPNIKIFSRDNQPVKCKLKGKIVYLSHGDKYETGILYNIYSKIIRTKFIIFFLKPFARKIINNLKKKNICYGNYQKIEAKIKLIINSYEKNSIIIEGHFHQGVVIDNYISLPSLVCQKQISIVQNDKIIFVDLLTVIDQF